MTAHELNGHIKEAVRAFGLSYPEINLIEVSFVLNEVRFKYENKMFTVYVNDKGTTWKQSTK